MPIRQVVVLTLFVLTFAAGFAVAGQVSYNVSFSGSSSFTGSFTYDTTNDVFTNFTVNYPGQVLDMLAGFYNANNPQFSLAGSPPCVGSLTGGAATFTAFTDPSCGPLFWNVSSNIFYMEAVFSQPPGLRALQVPEPVPVGGNGAFGQFTVTPVAVPEPGSATLLLLAMFFTHPRARRFESRGRRDVQEGASE